VKTRIRSRSHCLDPGFLRDDDSRSRHPVWRRHEEKRMRSILTTAVLAASLACTTPAFSQYPAKTIRVIVPFAAGSVNDLIARVVTVMGELIETYQPRIVVVACNTASTIVLPELRGSTILPRLLMNAYEEGWRRGVRFNFCWCRPRLIALYERLGFRRAAGGNQLLIRGLADAIGEAAIEGPEGCLGATEAHGGHTKDGGGTVG
jgi:GNAT superfamily N-acetyltransferase